MKSIKWNPQDALSKMDAFCCLYACYQEQAVSKWTEGALFMMLLHPHEPLGRHYVTFIITLEPEQLDVQSPFT